VLLQLGGEEKGRGKRREQVEAWREEGGGVVVLVPAIKRGRERGPRRQQRARSSRALPLVPLRGEKEEVQRRGTGRRRLG
jgi:hypothetical protein